MRSDMQGQRRIRNASAPPLFRKSYWSAAQRMTSYDLTQNLVRPGCNPPQLALVHDRCKCSKFGRHGGMGPFVHPGTLVLRKRRALSICRLRCVRFRRFHKNHAPESADRKCSPFSQNETARVHKGAPYTTCHPNLERVHRSCTGDITPVATPPQFGSDRWPSAFC